MQSPSTPPWMAGYSPRRGSRQPDPGLRVSDAERAEVADRLSRHYADGRLDQAEFDERMSRAMNARTHGDFAGLFADLPDLPDQQGQAGQAAQPGSPGVPGTCGSRGRRGRGLGRLVLLALLAVIAIMAAHAVVHWFVPWVLIAVLVFLLLREGSRRRRRI